MKKKILFIMESLGIGGAEKSLVTILNLIDYSEYDVDLFLFAHCGDFMDMIPKEVNILPEDEKYKIFKDNRKKSFIKYIMKLDFKSAFYSICWLIGVLFSKFKKQKLYIGWKYVKNLFSSIEKEYDTSIAFLERKTIYFNVDKVNSRNKIGFIHNDYSKYPYDEKLDKYYFSYYNKIATVSEHCKEVLIELFPEYRDKFIVIKNMVSKDLIEKLSNEKINNYNINKDFTNIVSVGRLVKQKGFDIAIEICKKLVNDNYKVHWYIIGEGEERGKLEELIIENKLENNLFLVGADTNPYKWMKIADIYVQPSRFEGYGITVAEAKVLNKVIIASDIPEFRELLDKKELLFNNKENLYNNIIKVIKEPEHYLKLEDSTQKEGYFEELEKIYEIIG